MILSFVNTYFLGNENLLISHLLTKSESKAKFFNIFCITAEKAESFTRTFCKV